MDIVNKVVHLDGLVLIVREDMSGGPMVRIHFVYLAAEGFDCLNCLWNILSYP